MKIVNTSLSVQTSQQFEIINITEQVVRTVTESGVKEGVITISVP
ncbi:MAG: YjbQ family protein, partial [Candidatus Doudnabacteria bacterium]|nr:YjbQ family protein [Candidatus Doudnabacteria bacterium]